MHAFSGVVLVLPEPPDSNNFYFAKTTAIPRTHTKQKQERMPQLSHMVYFTLQDDSESKIAELVNACKKYLDDHPGVLYFSVGTLNQELARPVNDRGYHVTLNVVFDSRDSHDLYQVALRHLEFIAEQKPNWKQVRIFDSDLV